MSSDGETWTRVFSGESSGTASGAERVDFDAVRARFLRITEHGNSLNQWNSICEAAVLSTLR